MPARKKASKKAAAKKRAPARKRPAAKKAAKSPVRQAQPKAPPSPPSGIGLLSQHMDYTTHRLADVQWPIDFSSLASSMCGVVRVNERPGAGALAHQIGGP